MTQNGEADISDVIIRIVRGEVPWSSLRRYGVDVRKERNSWSWRLLPVIPRPVAPLAADVAAGLVALHSRPDSLKEWASFLLAASPFVTFDAVTASSQGEALLEVLWDIQSGRDQNDHATKIAERVLRPLSTNPELG